MTRHLSLPTLRISRPRRVGGAAIATNDDFFRAEGEPRQAGAGGLDPRQVHSQGKWMDGWESRRRRAPGHDWCIVQLGMRGVVHGVDVDTSHFTGNLPSHVLRGHGLSAAAQAITHAAEGRRGRRFSRKRRCAATAITSSRLPTVARGRTSG